MALLCHLSGTNRFSGSIYMRKRECWLQVAKESSVNVEIERQPVALITLGHFYGRK